MLCWGCSFCLDYDGTVETRLELGADAAVAGVGLGRLLECTALGSLNPQPCNKCSRVIQKTCLGDSLGG